MLPPPSTGQFECFDIEEHSEIAFLRNTRFEQLSRGSFHSSTKFVTTGNLFLYRQIWNTRLHVRGSGADGRLLLGGNVSNKHALTWNGQEICATNLALTRSEGDVDFTTGATASHVVLLANEDWLAEHLNLNGNLAKQLQHYTLSCSPDLRNSFLQQLNQLIEQQLLINSPDSNCPGRLELENIVLDSLCTLLLNSSMQVEKLTAQKRRRIFQQAIELAENLRERISIPALARQLGVSQRTLEYAFKSTIGLSPVKYLMLKRLHGLHVELRRANPADTTVKQLCHTWGFTEIGRTAVEYRKHFGQSPSATLGTVYSAPARGLEDLFAAD